MLRSTFLSVLSFGFASQLAGQPSPQPWQGVPEQVLPSALEVGIPAFVTPLGSPQTPGSTGGNGGGGSPYSGGGGSALQAMMSQSYGQTAFNTAQQLGINPEALAGFGQLESGFRNVPTANGTSSATGPWQITTGTFNEYVSRNNLPYSAADITNPQAQAVVANYIIKDYSSQVSTAIGSPATVQQAYGAWVFGVQGGSRLAAAADPSTPMSNFISPRALSNNNMTGWTVGQFYNRVESKLGGVASQTVRA